MMFFILGGICNLGVAELISKYQNQYMRHYLTWKIHTHGKPNS
jgi:hypothetical protein